MTTITEARPLWFHCIEACQDCEIKCVFCADRCMEGGGMEQCARLCRDCAEVCELSARFMARGSSFVQALCDIAADLCEACAVECEKHDMDHCIQTAEACRLCAKECRGMTTTDDGTRAM